MKDQYEIMYLNLFLGAIARLENYLTGVGVGGLTQEVDVTLESVNTRKSEHLKISRVKGLTQEIDVTLKSLNTRNT